MVLGQETKDQWKIVLNQEKEQHIHGQLFSDKDFVMAVYWRKNRIFHWWCWDSWLSTCKTYDIAVYSVLCSTINRKWS